MNVYAFSLTCRQLPVAFILIHNVDKAKAHGVNVRQTLIHANKKQQVLFYHSLGPFNQPVSNICVKVVNFLNLFLTYFF